MESKKYNKLVSITKKKKTHRYREQASGYQWGEGRGETTLGWGSGRYKLLGVRQATRLCCIQHGEYSQYFLITVNEV